MSRSEGLSQNQWKHYMIKGIGPNIERPNRHAPYLDYFVHTPHPGKSYRLVGYQIHPRESLAKNVVWRTIDEVVTTKRTENIVYVPVGSPLGERKLDYQVPGDYERLQEYVGSLDPKTQGLFKEYLNYHKPDHDGSGRDLNWSMDRDDDPEVQLWKELLGRYPIDSALMVHHDYERKDEVYGYVHLPEGSPIPIKWDKFMSHLTSTGVKPFTGVDDVEKPALGNFVNNGLVVSHPEEEEGKKFRGNFENLLIELGAKYAITFELPNGLTEKGYHDLLLKIFNKLLIRI